MKKHFMALVAIPFSSMAFAQVMPLVKNTIEVYTHPINIVGTARNQGMAGAMGALGGDLSSFSVNPAGAGVYLTGEAILTGNAVSNTNTSTLDGHSLDHSTKDFNLQQVGSVIVFNTKSKDWKNVNIGINYTRTSVENYIQTPGNAMTMRKVKYDGPNNTELNDQLLFNGHAYDRVGRISTTNISLGGNYQDRIYLGAGINLHSTNIEQADFFQLKMQNLGETAYYQHQDTPYQELGRGISLSAGVIGRLSNGLRLGASIESPKWFTIDRSYTEYGENQDNHIVSRLSTEQRRLLTPVKTTLSIAYVAGKNLAINADWGILLSKPSYQSLTPGGGKAEAQLNEFFQSTSQPISDLRIGAEYRLGDLRLRTGYAYSSNPLKPQHANLLNSSSSTPSSFNNLTLSSRNKIAGGLGYNFKSFFIDAAVEYSSIKYTNAFLGGDYASTIDNAFSVVAGDTLSVPRALVSTIEQKLLNISFGAGWRF